MTSIIEAFEILTWDEIQKIYQWDRTPLKETRRSRVYKLSSPSHKDKQFVLKELHPRLIKDAESVREFIEEARILKQLRSENSISQIHGFFCQDNCLYILQEYIDGVDLAQFIDYYQEPLKEDWTCWIGLGICDGLEAIHKESLIHVDLNPDNIVLTTKHQPHIKIIDLGSAISLSSVLKRNASLKATLPYISPEHRPGDTISPQSDIYCLGLILIELLTKFISSSREVDANRILEAIVEFPISADFKGILTKMLCPNLNERYQSIKDVHKDLYKFLQMRDSSQTIIKEDFLRVVCGM